MELKYQDCQEHTRGCKLHQVSKGETPVLKLFWEGKEKGPPSSTDRSSSGTFLHRQKFKREGDLAKRSRRWSQLPGQPPPPPPWTRS